MSESLIVGDKSHLPIHQRRKSDTAFDRIWKFYYMTDKQVQLTEWEEKWRQRMEMAWMMDCTLLNRHKIALRLKKKYGICLQTAYDDIKRGRALFSDPTQQNKDAKREIMNHLIENALRKAIAQENYYAIEKLMLRYDRNNGLSLKDDDPMAELMKKQKPAQISFSSDPETLKKQAADLIKDIDYEEVDESES